MEQEISTTPHTPVSKKFDNKKNLLIGLGAVVVILIVVAVAHFDGSLFNFTKKLSPTEAKAKAEEFINKNLVQGTTATVASVTDYSDSLYKLSVQVGTNTIESFISKDGKEFFPQAMNIDDVNNGVATTNGTANTAAATATTANAPVVAANVPKSDKPKVELFIMSHCPYGTQIEKGMTSVVRTLGSKMDFAIKFVNYSMHGPSELVDNINQYCIGTEQNAKYMDYLDCFLKAGDSKSCIASTGIDQNKLTACYNATDSKYKITANSNDKTTYSGSFPTFLIDDQENKTLAVQGSPTLIINGKQVDSNRDSASLLATICSAFTTKPAECDAKLATATPAPGFGTDTTAAGSGSNANCAPTN